MTAHRFTSAPSAIGILVGTVFLAVSLSPSLLPRPVAVQGVLSGLSFAVGYGLGVAALGVWRFLGLPTAGARSSRILTIVAGAACALLALAFLWRASAWQNNIRELMGITESPPSGSLMVGLIAAVVFRPAVSRKRMIIPRPSSASLKAVIMTLAGSTRQKLVLGGRLWFLRPSRRRIERIGWAADSPC